jgi:hypothetical protein
VPLLGTRPPTTPAGFRIIEAAVTVLLDAGFSPQDAADGVDCTGRPVIGHVLAQAGLPPGGDIDDGEAEHRQTQGRVLTHELGDPGASSGQGRLAAGACPPPCTGTWGRTPDAEPVPVIGRTRRR